ncbi:ABC transporter substrate-binding protein [Paenibacillus sp. KACC 21273]|uniref:ABC transporter substrate-binding protein n=1 Tax=Paenibacillus sp. KACC 21273 TaxID=3025665 RepID=UPI0023660B9F|nr:ABC transporter substrate-binding protein [Paenibacillus sp. KACC 21273]WDF51063.1 ABC transporter substrate-binding protein [Paenibacillus sp. KACC 21273]
MKLHHQFLLLHSQYGQHSEVQITLDELATTFECTHRNALNLITRMTEQGWIKWSSQRGRGRRSTLTFIIQPEEIAIESMMQTIQRKDIQQTLTEIRQYAQSSTLENRVQDWLFGYFGPHSEIQRNRQVDTLRLPIRQQIHTVDPLYMNLLAESFVSSHIFDGLVRQASHSQQIIPHLAHAWEVNEQRTVWTFFLRKEVMFHHGQMMTADDIVYTFQRLMETSQPMLYRFIAKQIQSVQALNNNTVQIILKQPSELFLPFLCTSRAAIVPNGLNRRGEELFGVKPSGTGPFRMVEMSKDNCVLEVFKPHFQGRAHLDQVEIIHIPWNVAPDQLEQTDRQSPFHMMHQHTSGSASEQGAWSQMHSPVTVRKFVTYNTRKEGLLRDPHIRAHISRCLQYAREAESLAITSTIFENSSDHIENYTENNSTTNNNTSSASHDSLDMNSRSNYSYPKKLHPELDQATIAQIAETPLRILTIPQYRKDAHWIADTLQQAGYQCNVVSTPVEQFKGSVRMESDLIVFSLTRDQDEQLRLFDLYRTLAGHVEHHTVIDIEHLLEQIQRQPDPLIRTQYFQQIEDRLLAEYQLHILYEKPFQTTYLPSVRGVTFNSQGWVDLRHIWFPPKL